MRTITTLALAAWVCPALVFGQINGNAESGASAPEITARIIGVQQQIAQLAELSPSATDGGQISIRQEIYARVLATSLEVDATNAQIDNEIAQANEVHGYLADRRDRQVNRSNLLSALVGGGMSTVSAGLQLPSGQTKSSAAAGIAGGAAAAGLAVSGIREQKGGTRVLDLTPTCWPCSSTGQPFPTADTRR